MKSISQYFRQSLTALILLFLCLSYVHAQENAHDVVQRSLVHLNLSGTPQSGPNVSVAGGVQSQGTGFIVSKDGFILTTRHVFNPLKKVNAVNTEIEARVGDAASDSWSVQFVSDLPSLDLVLLKANIPFDTSAPPALDIGSSALINPNNPQALLTSGFHGRNYRRTSASLNDTKSSDVPYAWTINVKTNSGQSGSPVYIQTDAGEVKVVGIVKATSRADDELTIMVPIEFSMPLIGHLKIQELSDNVDFLMRVIGEITDTDMPLHNRVQDIEGHVEEIETHFTWLAESQPDGSILISYEKIISGGPQVDKILVNMTPYMRFYTEGANSDIYAGPNSVMRLPNDGQFQRTLLDSELGRGEFVIPGIAAALKTAVILDGRAVGFPEPYRDVEISLVPVVGDQKLSLRKLTVVPDFDWDNTSLISSN